VNSFVGIVCCVLGLCLGGEWDGNVLYGGAGMGVVLVSSNVVIIQGLELE
jgi:hypothetical protein